ncbi:MAG: hypothetical protein MHPSP_002685 [Paramarteilia canceri]
MMVTNIFLQDMNSHFNEIKSLPLSAISSIINPQLATDVLSNVQQCCLLSHRQGIIQEQFSALFTLIVQLNDKLGVVLDVEHHIRRMASLPQIESSNELLFIFCSMFLVSIKKFPDYNWASYGPAIFKLLKKHLKHNYIAPKLFKISQILAENDSKLRLKVLDLVQNSIRSVPVTPTMFEMLEFTLKFWSYAENVGDLQKIVVDFIASKINELEQTNALLVNIHLFSKYIFCKILKIIRNNQSNLDNEILNKALLTLLNSSDPHLIVETLTFFTLNHHFAKNFKKSAEICCGLIKHLKTFQVNSTIENVILKNILVILENLLKFSTDNAQYRHWLALAFVDLASLCAKRPIFFKKSFSILKSICVMANNGADPAFCELLSHLAQLCCKEDTLENVRSALSFVLVDYLDYIDPNIVKEILQKILSRLSAVKTSENITLPEIENLWNLCYLILKMNTKACLPSEALKSVSERLSADFSTPNIHIFKELGIPDEILLCSQPPNIDSNNSSDVEQTDHVEPVYQNFIKPINCEFFVDPKSLSGRKFPVSFDLNQNSNKISSVKSFAQKTDDKTRFNGKDQSEAFAFLKNINS